MPSLDPLLAYLRESAQDDFLSKDEKKGLREVIGKRRFSKQEIELLNQLVFNLAKSRVTDGQSTLVFEWIRQTLTVLEQSAFVVSEAYFSPGDECRKAIIDQIARAVKTIRIAVFTISDDHIVDAILTAHQKGKRIRILTDNDKSLDLGSDITRLTKAGVSVRMDTTPAHMHHKFMLIDDAVLLTGSYNWTNSAARSNYENIIVTNDEKLVSSFEKEFEKLWTLNTF